MFRLIVRGWCIVAVCQAMVVISGVEESHLSLFPWLGASVEVGLDQVYVNVSFMCGKERSGTPRWSHKETDQ